ncbi:hypothetical protein [Variovorax sp. Root411]|uniref:hypothetical protein n=1 Tax=Variovorax sp. Root411 TaxID=1736530 RepID=UPI0006F768FE|nr:hypothetical protein [Variovorax sp. Root411]KQW63548.1 hypothetical protein ASC92_23555 [Variovorax sp. Root411]
MKRVIVWLILAGSIAGCAGPRDFAKQPVAPKDIAWLEPKDREAIVYLLRAPHDKSVLVPSVDDAPTSALPPETYIALRFPPGTYRLAGAKAGAPESKVVTLPIELKAGDRRFFYASAVLANPDHLSDPVGTAVGASFGLIGAVAATAIAASMIEQPAGYGTHRWVECADLDARGLASISSLVQASSEVR